MELFIAGYLLITCGTHLDLGIDYGMARKAKDDLICKSLQNRQYVSSDARGSAGPIKSTDCVSKTATGRAEHLWFQADNSKSSDVAGCGNVIE